MSKITSFLLVLALTLIPLAAQSSGLLTRPEKTDYRETTRYVEVMEFLESAARLSDKLHLSNMGYTLEGRRIPLLIISRDGLETAQQVRESDRTVVYLQGNIHAGEVCGKEALLILVRDLVEGRHREWLDSMVLLVAPIYNADGNERIRLTNRSRQNGPIGGMGQRPNAQGLDLNRDHMKLESPEARSFVSMLNRYDPRVLLDLHTTDGSYHAYHLTYAPPLNPDTPAEIDDFLRQSWLPQVTDAVREKEGWEFYYYGNVPGGRGGNRDRGWYTFDHRPRFNNNYLGLRNRFGILSEAYAYATFQERVLATLAFVRENLEFTHLHGEEIRQIASQLDARSLIGSQLATRATIARSDAPVKILMGEVETLTHPYTGRPLLNRLDVQHEEMMPEFGTFTGTHLQSVPAAYLIPQTETAVIRLLQAHGVQMQALEEVRSLSVEEFQISDTQVTDREFQGHRERSLEGSYQTLTREVPAGTWQVPMNQPLARLIFYLLEPESDDGVLDWNLLDESLAESRYPIWRVSAPVH